MTGRGGGGIRLVFKVNPKSAKRGGGTKDIIENGAELLISFSGGEVNRMRPKRYSHSAGKGADEPLSLKQKRRMEDDIVIVWP